MTIDLGANVKVTVEASQEDQAPTEPALGPQLEQKDKPEGQGPASYDQDADAMTPFMGPFSVPAAHSDRVFIDVSSYNSKSYFVLGDVQSPGRLPWTGRETVLEALNYAGGLIPTAEPKNIKLVRPARAGKPARIYAIDYDAIVERGETEKNYQLFPGDRLVVGRTELAKKTIEIDQLTAPYHSMVHTMLQYAYLARVLDQLRTTAPAVDGSMPPAQRDELIATWLKTWFESLPKAGEPVDTKVLEELLKRTPMPSKAHKD